MCYTNPLLYFTFTLQPVTVTTRALRERKLRQKGSCIVACGKRAASNSTYKNSSVDEVRGRRTLLANSNYRLNHAIVVKLYRPYTQFSRNVRLAHRRIATFSANRDFFWLLRLINTLTYLLGSFLLITVYGSSMQYRPANHVIGKIFIRRPKVQYKERLRVSWTICV